MWEDTIKINLKGREWIPLFQDTVTVFGVCEGHDIKLHFP